MAAPSEEGQLLRLEEWVDVVSMHKAGISIKRIARTLGVSRNTVRATFVATARRSTGEDGCRASSTHIWTTCSTAEMGPESLPRKSRLQSVCIMPKDDAIPAPRVEAPGPRLTCSMAERGGFEPP